MDRQEKGEARLETLILAQRFAAVQPRGQSQGTPPHTGPEIVRDSPELLFVAA